MDMEKSKNEVLVKIQNLQGGLEEYKNLLVKQDTSMIMSTVSNLAQRSNLQIVSFRPAPDQKLQDYVRSPFYLEANAPNYDSIGRFVSEIENLREIYIIENLGVRPNTQPEQQGYLTVTMTFVTISAPSN